MKSAIPIGMSGAILFVITPVTLGAQGVSVPDSLPPGVTIDMVARGKVVFEGEGLCANCHGADATGLLGPNLTDADWWHAKGNYLEIVTQILGGVPPEKSTNGVAMPPRGGSSISDAEVQAAAAYVWALSHPEAGDSLPIGVSEAMVQQGREVFAGEGGCANCHGTDATGALGPDLTDHEWLHAKGSYLAIVRQILVGVPAQKSRNGIAMQARGGSNINDSDVHAVAAYVWVLSRR